MSWPKGGQVQRNPIEKHAAVALCPHQDALLLVAGVVRLVHVVVAVALVVGGQAAALVLAQVLQRPRLDDHALQRDRLLLLNRSKKGIRIRQCTPTPNTRSGITLGWGLGTTGMK